jgi:hypothetical protein
VKSHKVDWVHKALLVQKGSQLEIFVILYSLVIELDLIEISLSIIEFVNIVL